jgi:hypothetical protein
VSTPARRGRHRFRPVTSGDTVQTAVHDLLDALRPADGADDLEIAYRVLS